MPSLRHRLARVLRHPLSAFPVTCVLCLVLREFYPLSHFPMYSGIAKTQHYFFLEREEGVPAMTRDYFGISASALKKMYHSHLRDLREELDKDTDQLSQSDYARAGDSLLAQLLERERDRKGWEKAPLKELRLVRVDIERKAEGIAKERSFITSTEVGE